MAGPLYGDRAGFAIALFPFRMTQTLFAFMDFGLLFSPFSSPHTLAGFREKAGTE